MDDTITITLHTALSNLDKRNTHVRMLLIDYHSAFNTVVPSKVITKLGALGLNPIPCNWVIDFLTGQPQVVNVGNNTSTTLILNRGGPNKGACSAHLLYSLFTNDSGLLTTQQWEA
jgi:gmma-aminobutyric acid receptor subunit gamma/cGMP-dependent protein kinase 2